MTARTNAAMAAALLYMAGWYDDPDPARVPCAHCGVGLSPGAECQWCERGIQPYGPEPSMALVPHYDTPRIALCDAMVDMGQAHLWMRLFHRGLIT